MRSAAALLLATSLLTGCNAYDYFRITGFQQESFTNKADILFVLDNSPSMVDEGEALAVNFASFINQFADDAPPTSKPSLGDEVDRFIEYVQDRTGNVNYQIGITTTEVYDKVGRLVGENPVLRKADENVPQKFNNNLLCEAACLTSQPPVAVQCAQGSRPGTENCADSLLGAAEEGIEAVYMAMCRASPNPPENCFQDWYLQADRGVYEATPPPGSDTGGGPPDPVEYFGPAQVGTNAGWLREGSVVIPVIITDEGDQSRRINDRSGDVFPYGDLFNAFGHRMSWAVIGPNLDCNLAGAVAWGVDRYKNMVDRTSGVYVDIAQPSGSSCATTDFADALNEIGKLLRGLADTFPLQNLPVPGTIVVEVNGKVVPEATPFETSTGRIEFDDGWLYLRDENTVVLRGNAVPDFNADVRIWYQPASGLPRTLPF